ncbi:MAG: hypothetical protein K6B74_02430 [Ruminococcus sp.]|nr:hypothetical protein [Ruminococcus sp.]
MKRSDKITANAALMTTAALIYLSNKVAAQFADEKEAKRYLLRQSVLSAGVSAGTALMLRAVVKGMKSKLRGGSERGAK